MWYSLVIRESQTSNRLMRFIEMLQECGTVRILDKKPNRWLIEVWVSSPEAVNNVTFARI